MRFIRESMVLAPWRMMILLLQKTISSLGPTARLWVTSHMLGMVERAVNTGEVHKLRLFSYALIGATLSSGLQTLNGFL